MKDPLTKEMWDACNHVRTTVSKMSQEERSKLLDSFMARINGDIPKKDIITEQINIDERVMSIDERVMSILKSMYDMAQSEDWDKSSAQMLIMNGSSLYLAIKNDL